MSVKSLYRVLIVSDTHSYAGTEYLKDLDFKPDEIWHAGDLGSLSVADAYAEIAPFRAVYGNIDNAEIRATFPEIQSFVCQGNRILMLHIAGRPGRYNSKAGGLIKEYNPDVFICGHSHICTVERDKRFGHLHINPGAIGKHGFHKFRTCIVLIFKNGKPTGIKVLEYPR